MQFMVSFPFVKHFAQTRQSVPGYDRYKRGTPDPDGHARGDLWSGAGEPRTGLC